MAHMDLPEPVKQYYDTVDICAILGVTRARIHQYVREGRLSPIDPAKHTPIFTPEEVRRFLGTHKKSGRPKGAKGLGDSADNV